jgi:hypothetical protein
MIREHTFPQTGRPTASATEPQARPLEFVLFDALMNQRYDVIPYVASVS